MAVADHGGAATLTRIAELIFRPSFTPFHACNPPHAGAMLPLLQREVKLSIKRAFAVTGVAVVIAMLLSSPTFAQTSQPSLNAKPAPAPAVEPAADVPLDGLMDEAMTPEDRARMLLRCIGPPPRQLQTTRAESQAPASELAVIADTPSPVR